MQPQDPEAELARQVSLIRASGLFDEAWYLEKHPDVAAAGDDPIAHYLTVGAALGFDPHPLFDTTFYANQMLLVGKNPR